MTGRPGRTGRGAGQASAGELLELVRSRRAVTRGALQQVTGLSRATVGQRLDRLFRAGWLREGAGGPVDSPLGGRPSITLEFDDEHAAVLAADLDTRHARAAVLSLSGEILAEHSGTLVVEDGPDTVLGELGRWFAELLQKAGQGAESVCGVGLAVPGPVDTETGRVVQPPIMPGWDGYDIRSRLARALTEHTGAAAVPVLVDNDANLMAYGEQRTGYPDCSAFVLVKVSTGIGAGVVVDGSVFRGIDGGAGDIGHIRVPEGAQALCRCGSTAVWPPWRVAALWRGGWPRPGCPRPPARMCGACWRPGIPRRSVSPGRPGAGSGTCWRRS